MPYSRYDGRPVILNNKRNYKNTFFKERGMSQMYQYSTAVLSFPTPEEIRGLTNVSHRWGATDKLYNLSNDYYKSPQYWWIIAWYNQKPTESHFKVGDIIYVPLPLDRVLEYF